MRFKISRKGVVVGEFDFLEVVDALAEGRFTGKDYFWTEGMADWSLLSDFAEFNQRQAAAASAPAAARKAVASVSRERTRAPEEPRCPSCSSKSVQACGMGFAAGTRTSESLGISSRGRAYFRTGHSSSVLASALAPPTKSGPHIIFVILFLGGLVGCAFWYANYAPTDWRPIDQTEKWTRLVLAVLALVGGLWGIISGSIASDQEYSEAMREWEKQWFCKKCGAIFTPEL